MPDHYATLGVEPTANAAVIRAAYLALMREYHPDRNPSAEAVLRSQAIIAAFKVVGDFDRRNHYDWDRRREREAAAAALSARRPGGKRTRAIRRGAVGLAAVGASLFLPIPSPEPAPTELPVAQAQPVPLPKQVALAPTAQPEVKERLPVATIQSEPQPLRVAKAEPMLTTPKVSRAPVAAVEISTPRLVPLRPRPAKAVVKLVQPTPKPATDLASLDQFVMNFYGQSWRYGDAPKRAALVQSRENFIARRGSCLADACKRAAYLRLMRDVSEIVETGQPTTR